jgi:hypothetical protein
MEKMKELYKTLEKSVLKDGMRLGFSWIRQRQAISEGRCFRGSGRDKPPYEMLVKTSQEQCGGVSKTPRIQQASGCFDFILLLYVFVLRKTKKSMFL